MSEMVHIPLREYMRLQEAAQELQALYNAGVDNWDGYGIAMGMLEGGDE